MAESRSPRTWLSRLSFWFALFLLVAGWALGCNAAQGDGKTGSETNWLSKCARDSDCTTGACVCGACNVACAASAECGGLPLPAACATASAAAYPGDCPPGGPPSGVCLPSCDAENPCSPGQVCDSGLCAPVVTTPTALPVPLEDFVTAFCTAARNCCVAQGIDLTPLANCESYLTTPVNPLLLDQLYRSIDLEPHKFVILYQAQTVTIDDTALAACVAALREAATTCAAQPVQLCASAFRGTEPVGAACRLVEECAQPPNGDAVFCVRPAPSGLVAAGLGTCTLAPHGQVSDSCHSTCAIGGVCSGQPGTINVANPSAPPVLTACYLADGLRCGQGCQPPKQLGDACSDVGECADGLTCFSDSTCAPPGELGGFCRVGNDCAAGLECDSGACANRSFGTALLCSGTYDP